ncbi:MAG: NAD(+) synthase [Clostridia bacterium]|nr:NAD(+) synthase [Clostridia bacterium]
MNHLGYVRVMCASPSLKVGNCTYNGEQICESIQEAQRKQCDLVVFPELSTTGYTCGDLFLHQTLLEASDRTLSRIATESAKCDVIALVGAPVRSTGGALYNAAAVIYGGQVQAFVPKCNLPNYGGFNEMRYFAPFDPEDSDQTVFFDGEEVPMGSFVFRVEGGTVPYCFGAEICEDLWVPNPPSVSLAQMGAHIVVNLSANNETLGKDRARRDRVRAVSAQGICGYAYCDAGMDESTTDGIYAGHKLIGENGKMLKDSGLFGDHTLVADIDVSLLEDQRRRRNTFTTIDGGDYTYVLTVRKGDSDGLERTIAPSPFVPGNPKDGCDRYAQILNMQGYALKKRLVHTHAKTAVIGISGGLDSTLALLATVHAFDLAGLPRKNVYCVTMPCFGTSKRTYENAVAMCGALGVTLEEVNIQAAVLQHFTDIGHNPEQHDVTYENSQARERTQVLMDIANRLGGMVIGTGDLSELALGWATYNGDHMSMYGINASLPKTVIRHVVQFCADHASPELKTVLEDVLDTPVSPELLPPADGEIAQKTEDLVGPYELHDFFLYHFLHNGFSKEKILYLAERAFADVYARDYIEKWLNTFLRRFFQQQFKRSCLPDGPKIGSISLSPRGDFRMPSDAEAFEWLNP